MFLIADAGHALAHSLHVPHRFLTGLSEASGMSVRTVASRIRGPYCGLTIRRLFPCQPMPASRAAALWEMAPSRLVSSTVWEAGTAHAEKPCSVTHFESRVVSRSRVALTAR